MKFADRAKSVFSRIQPNEIQASDQGLIKKLTDEINNLKEILSLRKRRGNYGDIENQFVKLKEENEKLKHSTNNTEDVEKLIYENKVLKVELQKMRSKSDFYEDSNISNNANEKTPKTSRNENESEDNTKHIRIKSMKEMNLEVEKYNEDLTSKYNSKVNSIRDEIDNFSKLKNHDNNSYRGGESIDLKSPMSESINLDFLNKQVDGNNLNDVIDNLIVNNNNDSNIFSNKSYNKNSQSDNFDGDLSIKKSSLNSSLFKAGESLVSGQFSSIKNSETGALKKVNERLRYLEKLEKESSLNLNKQKEKIKNKNYKKEEEMKKKIEDVINKIILI